MKAPQIIAIVLMGMSLLISANCHGKPKDGKHSFWSGLIYAVMWTTILLLGGFFK